MRLLIRGLEAAKLNAYVLCVDKLSAAQSTKRIETPGHPLQTFEICVCCLIVVSKDNASPRAPP